jgi:hypothetical protein
LKYEGMRTSSPQMEEKKRKKDSSKEEVGTGAM